MITWPSNIVKAIARRRAVLVIGSGVSANSEAPDGRRPPTWGTFLETTNGKLGGRHRHIKDSLKRYNYLDACEYLREALSDTWNDIIRDNFSTPQYKAASIHEAIFNLDCRIVLSLNFDKIYENYALSRGEGTFFIKNYHDDDIRQVAAGEDRYILKPHGSVDTISKLIFTTKDYAEARTKYSAFYELITSLLHTHLIVCIGCGLSDPDMQLIFEDYRFKFSETSHYIILAKTIPDPQVRLIKNTRGLNVIQYSPRDNHKELTDSLHQLARLVSDHRDHLVVTRDW